MPSAFAAFFVSGMERVARRPPWSSARAVPRVRPFREPFRPRSWARTVQICSPAGQATFTATRRQIEGLSTMALQNVRLDDPIMSVTPAQLAGLGLGTGYQLPNAQSSPSATDVLASMSPQTRRYTEAVMNLTFNQLAAGAAGHP